MKPNIHLFSIIAIIVFFTSCVQKPKEQFIDEEETIIDTLYGITIDTLDVMEGKIQRGENLSQLLSKYGVDAVTIDEISKKCENIFDLRNIRSGNNYTILQTQDSLKLVRYFIYEQNPFSYVVFDFSDTISIYEESKEIEIKLRISSGTIKSSLWDAVSEIDANPELALRMSEIYAWAIDFYGLQKNDEFTVVYDEILVDDRPVNIGTIYYAVFRHSNKPFYAFRYQQDTISEYFNEEGENLRKAFLKTPLRFTRISSRFSYSRMHPIFRVRRPHHGVDYAAPTGTPVMTVGDGVVEYAGYSGGAGNMVKIKHNSTYSTAYMHLARFGKSIKKGVRVSQGQVIGYVGSTGHSTGPHLDFRFYKNGQTVDPLKVESPPVEPLREEFLPDFLKFVAIRKIVLDRPEIKNTYLPEKYLFFSLK